jgi:hypothetical protein
MDVREIEPEAVGRWVIITLSGGVHVLDVPPDGRATWSTTAYRRRHGRLEPTGTKVWELVAWGSYDVLTGMREGITVGESVVFVTEPLSADGRATAAISTPVLSITEVGDDAPRGAHV